MSDDTNESPSLYELTRSLQASELAVQEKLKELYPRGSWWRVELRSGQVNPSVMEVMSHPGGRFGYVRMALPLRPNRWGVVKKRFFRDVAAACILGPAQEPGTDNPQLAERAEKEVGKL